LRIIQTEIFQTSETITGTASIPRNDTIPQSNEGFEVMKCAITPTHRSNLIVVDSVANGSVGNTNDNVTMALFQDANANSLAACVKGTPNVIHQPVNLKLKYVLVADTADSTEFKIRVGANQPNIKFTFNGYDGTGLFGGRCFSHLTLMELGR